VTVLLCTYRKGTHYCNGSLYCLDTKAFVGPELIARKINITSQQVIRLYCCTNCGRRYKSLEVLNPVAYKIKPIPQSHLTKIGILEGEI